MQELMTIPEFAKWARMGRSTAFAAAQRGEIPTIRIGRLVRIPKAELERWLADRLEASRCSD